MSSISSSPVSTNFDINQIIVVDRKRSLGDITPLAQSIKEIGLLNPVTLRPDGTLIAGYHRLEACKSLGWESIPSTIVNLDTLNAELAEIDENLIRHELHWLDRDKQLARRKEIYETLHPETTIPGRGKNQHVPTEIISVGTSTFTQDTASKVGQTPRTVELSIQRANAFTEEQGEILKQAEITQTQATKLARLDIPERIKVIEEIAKPNRGGVPPALQMSESNEWYTPAPYVNVARELMGGIDVDPASNAYANEKVIQAATYYDIDTNGLAQEWRGRVWLNPPYGRDNGESNQETWSRRLLEQYKAGITTEAILLVNAVTDRKWFQPLWDFPICFTDHRIRFYNQETEAGQPTHGNALIYLYPHKDPDKVYRFMELFRQFGMPSFGMSALKLVVGK